MPDSEHLPVRCIFVINNYPKTHIIFLQSRENNIFFGRLKSVFRKNEIQFCEDCLPFLRRTQSVCRKNGREKHFEYASKQVLYVCFIILNRNLFSVYDCTGVCRGNTYLFYSAGCDCTRKTCVFENKKYFVQNNRIMERVL